MEKLRRENESLKTELAMEFRQFRKPVDSSSADRIAQVRFGTNGQKNSLLYRARDGVCRLVYSRSISFPRTDDNDIDVSIILTPTTATLPVTAAAF